MSTRNGYWFNPPPGWVVPPDWVPPDGWRPDPSWPPAPSGWEFWVRHRPAAPPIQPTSHPVEAVAHGTPQTASPRPAELTSANEAELVGLRARVTELESQLAQQTSEGPIELDDERVLQEVGIYRYHHPLEDAAQFKDRLKEIQDEIKALVKGGDAVLASDMFTFNNSLAKGRKMTSDLSKLMLRAYNAEADICVRALRAGNVATAKKRLERSAAAVAKLGSMMEMRINPDYHDLRLREIELTADFAMKKQEEREAEREERARLREERKVEQELAAERERLDKERAHLANALQALQEAGDEAGAAELISKLTSIDENIEKNDYRAANIRAGYVYVISNTGSFGRNMIKIGMTRRLEPMDRVRELGDASVPFPFDVHALFFSEDAVSLESELHAAFAELRVNHVNLRREYFFATPTDVREVLTAKVGNLLEFNEHPEASQYAQSKHYWPSSPTAVGPGQ